MLEYFLMKLIKFYNIITFKALNSETLELSKIV